MSLSNAELPNPAAILARAFREMWGPDAARSKTLARIVQHKRQCEAWWKFEVATHLWDFTEEFGPNTDIFVEAFDRTDVAIASANATVNGFRRICIPIELKMIGTWWGASNVQKAYSEAKSKRLMHDMVDAQDKLKRGLARPFSAIALLVTHTTDSTSNTLHLYLQRARELGAQHALNCVVDEPIPLPTSPDTRGEAHQFLWITSVNDSPG